MRQKSLYFVCHSGLDPESSISELDSRFRGNDGFENNVKKCWTHHVSYLLFRKLCRPIEFWNEMVDLVNKILSNIFNRFIHTRRVHKRKGPFRKSVEWALFVLSLK
jgi:hypothetical protein